MHVAVRVAPDLWASRVDVALAVRDIVKLIGPNGAVRFRARFLLSDTARHFGIMVVVRRLHSIDFYQFGAQRDDGVFLLLALRTRHHHDDAIAERRADKREANAGVARGPFNN